MSKLTSFKKSDFANIRADFAEAVKGMEAKYGIKLDMGSISFSDSSFTTKLTVVIVDGAPSDLPYHVNPKWKNDFTRSCMFLGFKVEDFGSKVKVGHDEFYLVGAQARKPNLILQRPGQEKFVSVPATRVTK